MVRHVLRAEDQLFGADLIPANSKAIDFWSWAFGDLCDDDIKGWFAEWMVGKLLALPSARRVSWANSDLITPEGVRIEVKSSAYWQSWKLIDEFGRARLSPTHKLPEDRAIQFGGLQARDAVTTCKSSDLITHKSHLYVFAFQHEKNPELWNALDLGQWEFYVFPVEEVREIPTARIGLLALRDRQAPLTADKFAVVGRRMIAEAFPVRSSQATPDLAGQLDCDSSGTQEMIAREAEKRELILISGVEGGGITLYGERTANGWRFSSNFVDQTPLMLADGDQCEIRRKAPIAESWDEALKLLDQLGWLRLPAIMVHKEFRQKVWGAVQERLGSEERDAKKLQRWRERCRIDK